jgi:MFS family permease
VLLPLLVLLPRARGLSLLEIGVLMAVHGVVATVLEVPSGAVADAVGRKRTLLVGAGALVLSLTAFAFARDLAAFCAAEALLARAGHPAGPDRRARACVPARRDLSGRSASTRGP